MPGIDCGLRGDRVGAVNESKGAVAVSAGKKAGARCSFTRLRLMAVCVLITRSKTPSKHHQQKLVKMKDRWSRGEAVGQERKQVDRRGGRWSRGEAGG